MAGLLAQLAPATPGTSAYTTLAEGVPLPQDPHVFDLDNGDINLASTVTSNILLAGQQGKLTTFDQGKFADEAAAHGPG